MSMIDQLREAVGSEDEYVSDADIESLTNNINISYTDGTSDTITINSGINQIGSLTSAQISTLSPCYTITGGGGCYTTVTSTPGLTVGGGIGTNCHTWGINGTSAYSFAGISPTIATVNITDKGIEMAETADIKVGGRSLMAFMKTMEERLAILVPDPAKMEKFAALKKAYDNYKLLEKLCQEEDKVE